jgi:drug/metabolite transporter (DMT)-like permease
MAAGRWRLNAPLLAGILLGFGGVGLLMGRSALNSGPGVFAGSLAVVLGALSWSVGIVYSRRSHLSGHPLLLSALSLLAGSVQLLLVGTAVGEYRGFSFAAVSLRSRLALGYLIVFGSVVAFTAYNWLLEHYSPTLVATHTYVNPIVAVLLGWLFAGEAVTLNVLLSTALVISAVMLVDRGMGRLPQGS